MTGSVRAMGKILAVVVLLVALAGCGGGGSKSNDAATVPGEPSADTVKQWPAKWCSADLGVTRQKLVDIMGPPTLDGSDYAMWTGFGFDLKAVFDVNQTATYLYANRDTLSEAERASMPCGDRPSS